MDTGGSLPASVHVIDCACLLKQYLRSLPDPLLTPEVHAKVVACMKLEAETRVDAVALSILLLPRAHIHALLFLLDVSSSSISNDNIRNSIMSYSETIVGAKLYIPVVT